MKLKKLVLVTTIYKVIIILLKFDKSGTQNYTTYNLI